MELAFLLAIGIKLFEMYFAIQKGILGRDFEKPLFLSQSYGKYLLST